MLFTALTWPYVLNEVSWGAYGARERRLERTTALAKCRSHSLPEPDINARDSVHVRLSTCLGLPTAKASRRSRSHPGAV
jgi:hypothetical protein